MTHSLIRAQRGPRRILSFLLTLSLLGCVGEEVVLKLAADENHTGTESENESDTSFGETDTEGCGDSIWDDSVYIDYAPELRVLEGVTHIRGDLHIWTPNGDLREYIDSLAALRCVDGDFTIYNVDEIRDLDALGALHSIGEDLRIERNDRLENLLGLENLRNLGGTALYITDNDALPTCSARALYLQVADRGSESAPCIVDNFADDCDNLTRGCSDQYRW